VDPEEPQVGPVELGRHDDGGAMAVAVLADGRVVSGGGLVLVWDPHGLQACPVELGRHDDGGAMAVAVLRTAGWSAATTADGCGYGARTSRRPAWPSSAATAAGVTALVVLPVGRVVSADSDRRVRLWEWRRCSWCWKTGRTR
jgi:hypothetical protein